MDWKEAPTKFRNRADESRDSGAANDREDALELTVLCLLFVVSAVGVGLLATSLT